VKLAVRARRSMESPVHGCGPPSFEHNQLARTKGSRRPYVASTTFPVVAWYRTVSPS
jgi:hypothetical protein